MARQLWTVGLSVLACCLVMLAASLFNAGVAQQPKGNPPPPQANWRFQLVPWGTNHNEIMLIDTQTGRVWEKSMGGRWRDSEAPPGHEKR